LAFVLLYFRVDAFLKKDISLNNITIGQNVSLKDGMYDFKYNDVNNKFQLDNGLIEVENNKIISIVGYKKYGLLSGGEIKDCNLDAIYLIDKYDISKISDQGGEFFGYVGFKNLPSKTYSKISCKTITENNSLMTFSFSINEKININNSKSITIDSLIIDKTEWEYDSKTYQHGRETELVNKDYMFIHYPLGGDTRLNNVKYIIDNGIKLYSIDNYGIEKNMSKKNEEEIKEINKQLDAKLESDGTTNSYEEKTAANIIKNSHYISPNKIYLRVDKDGKVNGVYGIDISLVSPTLRSIFKSMPVCIHKMKGYADYLLLTYPLDGKWESFSYKGKIEKESFKLFDKSKNVTIELECKNIDLPRGSFMSIKFEKN
jgi:hypothetical protein